MNDVICAVFGVVDDGKFILYGWNPDRDQAHTLAQAVKGIVIEIPFRTWMSYQETDKNE